MNLIKNFFSFEKQENDISYMIFFLIATIILGYIIPTIVFANPSGTDVYSHMFFTNRMVQTNSLSDFYEKTFEAEDLNYDYPFGLWLFGSIVIKVTGMDIYQLVYIVPLILCIVFIFFYYFFSYNLLFSKSKSILAMIFLISMPIIALNLLQFATARTVSIFLLSIVYMSINKFDSKSFFIQVLLIFSLAFTHTGTYIFLIFFSIAYFIFFALFWNKFDIGMYSLIVCLLFIYVISVQFFPFIQPQYIDKGRMILTISDSFSSKLGLGIIKEMGIIFYQKVFVSANYLYLIFWSSFIFVLGKLLQYAHSKIGSFSKIDFRAIPILGNIKNVSHGIQTTPFWLGPVHSFFSVFGIFKLDERGKCISLSLALTALFPGAMESGENTGALREIYYLFLIVPISSAAGFFYIKSIITKRKNYTKINKSLTIILFIMILLPLILSPIIGNLYYAPSISGTQNEKENLYWLGKIGESWEGAEGLNYRERIDLYANKTTSSIPNGNEMRRFMNDLKQTYFVQGAEDNTNDLYSFNIEYIISSDRTLKGYGKKKDSLKIDSNKQLDKIYSSNNNFSIYKYVAPPNIFNDSSSKEYGLSFKESGVKIQKLGSTYSFGNDYYKVKIFHTTPEIKYIGTKTINLAQENGFSDLITISWGGAYKQRNNVYNLKELKYPYISFKDNIITYKTIIRDEKNYENWATLIVEYIFYEKAIQREIRIANDWVNSDEDLIMNVGIQSSLFGAISDFEFNQVGNEEENLRPKKIYPSQDSVVLKDKKFDEIFLNEGGTGLFIKYGDSAPFPTRISYKGSTISDYGAVSMYSSYSLNPSESISLIQYFSVGDKPTSKNNVEKYTSISQYVYPEAIIPIILTGFIDKNDDQIYSLNSHNELQKRSITYSEGIDPETMKLLGKDVNPLGYLNLYEKEIYKNISIQKEIIKSTKENLKINGVLFRSFKYNLNSIKVLSDNNIQSAEALTVSPPFLEFFREGLRLPMMAYYKGERTGVVFIPVTLPVSSILRPEYDDEKVFSQWKETMDSVIDDGGIAVFQWNAEDIGNPAYMNKFMDLINYSLSRNMSFITPDISANHFKLLSKISTNVTKGIDYFLLNVSNYNIVEVKGISYSLNMPMLNSSCPYVSINARISRLEQKDSSCRVFISFDLESGQHKEIKVEPNINRKNFGSDFSKKFEGNNLIRIKDNEGNIVNDTIVYVDTHRMETNYKGELEINLRRGNHTISIQKPGFNSREYEIEVRGRVYSLFDFLTV